MARYTLVNPEQFTGLDIVKMPDQEVLLSQNMAEFVRLWALYDPPMKAQYDLAQLEFDPAKIVMEAVTTAQLNTLTRINQAARAVTLAFAVGKDLDGVASRYPGGVPRVSSEIYADGDSVLDKMRKDARYRDRIWKSPNALGVNASGPGLEFAAMTALPEARDVSANVQRRPDEVASVLSVMMDGPNPIPTDDDLIKLRKYFTDNTEIYGLTDVISVRPAVSIDYKYRIGVWFYPWADQEPIITAQRESLDKLLYNLRAIGQDHTSDEIKGSLKTLGVHHTHLFGFPAGDVLAAGPDQFINVIGEPEIVPMGTAE